MATKTIVSGENKTPVGKSGTELFTKTRTTYTLDENGKIDPNSVKQEILYSQVPGDPPVIAATRNGTTGDFTLNKNEFTGEFYFGADAQKSLKEGALKTTTNQQIEISAKKEGLTPEQQKTISASTANSATDPGTGSSPAGPTDTGEATKTTKTSGFGDFVYPTGLRKTKQDVIKFTMLEYKPSGLGPIGQQRGGFGNARNEATNRNPAGTVVLPIPNGISDTNSVDWGANSMNALEAAVAAAAFTGITEGLGSGVESFGKSLSAAIGEDKTGRGLGAAFAGAALGGQSGAILSRADGAVINPNLELLFNGPQLRPFQFTFKLSARSKDESKEIIKILNFFKRGMSAIKTESNLFLKAPNTFKIQYLHLGQSGKDHPYIGRIKECALQSVTTSYTPEGQYATFSDGVMVSYQLTMQFQELEPVFNSDYDNLEGIGF